MILPLLLACATTLAPPEPAPEAAAPAPAEASSAPDPVRSDWGHPEDRDRAAMLEAYPSLRGTRLDDCGSCHCGGPDCAAFAAGGQELEATNACDWCHLMGHPEPGEAHPSSFRETLNPFGLAWHEAGRDVAAFAAVGELDSDGDGASNAEELASSHFPGDARSKPGQQPAPLRRFTLEQVRALPAIEQLLLSNAPSVAKDEYASYRGVRIRDLLEAAGVDIEAQDITGVTMVSPDGYRKQIAWDRVLSAAPASRFHAGLDKDTLGEDCGWVVYPAGADLPEPGAALPPAWAVVAWERGSQPLEPVLLERSTSKLRGDGPLRAVVPQARPGPPDRGSKVSPSGCDDGLDYDAEADHNAGWNVRGLVALRVDPLPEGLEDLDWTRGGWSWIERGELVVYGRGVGAR